MQDGQIMTNKEDQLYPVFELLQTRLEQGFYIKQQEGRFVLFNPDGNGHCSGKTVRDLLTNLIFTDC